MEKKFVVTIGREFGTGGRQIATVYRRVREGEDVRWPAADRR